MPTTPSFYQFLQQMLGTAPEPQSQLPGDIALPGTKPAPTWTPEMERQIETIARLHRIDPGMADRLVRAESNYNPMARGTSGELGLTQLMPETAVEMGVTNRADPEQSLHGGLGYLRKLIDRYGGDTKKALMAYNWGPTNVNKAILTPPTGKKAAGQRRARAYAAKVGGKE